MSLNDVNGAQTNINNAPVALSLAGSWQQASMPAIDVGSFVANEWVCVTLTASAQEIGNAIRIGRIDFSYLTA
jgi:hypothetical protein